MTSPATLPDPIPADPAAAAPAAPLAAGAAAPWRPTPLRSPVIVRLFHCSDVHRTAAPAPRGLDLKLSSAVIPSAVLAPDLDTPLLEWATELQADGHPVILVASGDFVQARAVIPKYPDGITDAERAAERAAADARYATAFAGARAFLDALADALGIPPDERRRRVVVCPGNHDVDRERRPATEAEVGSSTEAFDRALDGLLKPAKAHPVAVHHAVPGLSLFVIDTAFLGGTEFKEGDTTVELDAPVYPLQWIRDEIARAGPVPADSLGVVVAHHPPGNSATTGVELKLVDPAMAGEQALPVVHRAGYRALLHGHKHEPVAQRERVRRLGEVVQDVLVLGAPCLTEDYGTRGFFLIDAAVAPETGDATLRVRTFGFAPGQTPFPMAEWIEHVRGPARDPVALLRYEETVNEYGDTRTDVTYAGLRVPALAPGRSAGGWEHSNGALRRTLRRVEAAPSAQMTLPAAGAGQPGVQVRPWEIGANEVEGVRELALTVEVSAGRAGAGGRVPGAESEPRIVTVFERAFATNSYAVSAAQQRRVAGPSETLADALPGWECLVYSLREPAERLELVLNLPFALASAEDVSVYPCRAVARGGPADSAAPLFTRDDALAPFTRSTVDLDPGVAPGTGRIVAGVDAPLCGASYAVVWRLPDESPAVRALDAAQGAVRAHGKAQYEAERIRQWLLDQRGAVNGHLARALDSVVTSFRQRWVEAGTLQPGEQLEWALFTPDTSLFPQAAAAVGGVAAAAPPVPPHLVPVCANYADLTAWGDPAAAWATRWRAGRGIAGRAYATNAVERYFAEGTEGHDPSPVDPWTRRPKIYLPLAGRRHEVLVGFPIPHPSYTGPTVLLGSFCLGSFTVGSQFVPDAPLIETADEVAIRRAAALRNPLRALGPEENPVEPQAWTSHQLFVGAVVRAVDAAYGAARAGGAPASSHVRTPPG